MRTGSNTPGMAALANTASTTGPCDSTTSAPVTMSEATMWIGSAAFSSLE